MQKTLRAWVPVVILSALAGAVVAVGAYRAVGGNTKTTVIERQATVGAPSSSGAVPEAGVADLYASVRPQVVRISGSSASSGGVGSGVILDKQGHILTNFHVVNGMSQLTVRLSDGTESAGQVIARDPGDDLAVMKASFPADKLSPATFADPALVRVGDEVIAVGNPFELEGTLTRGVVSGLNRTLTGSSAPLRGLIQTDAAVNPGNSGGGLFDLAGRLIGVTTALENPSGSDVFVGVGYAVGVKTVQDHLSALLAGQNVTHPRIAISLEEVTPELAGVMGLAFDGGVLVDQVERGSGAAAAGLIGGNGRRAQYGDVIVGIDGHTVRTYNDLADYIDTKHVGDSVTLKIVRDGQEMTVPVRLDAWSS